MNRIDYLFKEKKQNILSIYFTAGFPDLNDTTEILAILQKNNVDMVEIGMPFSDPLADGPIIQLSSSVALKNGMSLKILFSQLTNIREKVNIPLLLMGYFNPIFKYGVEKFCENCSKIGIDGLIIPDMPLDEYTEKYEKIFNSYGIYNICLITPQTSEKRIKYIDSISKGFIYAVSTYSTTGSGKNIDSSKNYFERLKNMKLKNPIMIGFGIKDKASFNLACSYASGGIIGTAFIKALQEKGSLEDKITRFISTCL